MKPLIACVVLLLILLFDYDAVSGAAPPRVEARGAILVDFESGRVLWERNSDTELAMASTTKIMTAILCLENGNLSDTVTVSRKAAAAPKVKMYLSEGEKISLETLLYALMLQSSNDAAVAIAEHLADSVEEFCLMMTEKARSIGAVHTVFETPNGLDAGDHHSTAYDLAVIARYAMNNEQFVNLINTREYTGNSNRRTYFIHNKNRLLSEYSGANGIKTGFTGKAGYCFVGSAKRDDLWLISVVLGSGWGGRGREQRWADTRQLLNYGFNNYSVETILHEGNTAGSVGIERSKTPAVSVVYDETVKFPLTAQEKERIRLFPDLPGSVRAPVNIGDKIGVCSIYLDDEKLAEIDVLAAGAASRHDLKTSMEKVISALLEIFTVDEIAITLPEF
ncbi:MAG: D-alanyl-D-alanine carboxypeptidase [Defluviitaleaceae bacterium]|nr:D-alanyl-D-alanine carboxypeptidase [Defluviitaleaceae bacterium]MCL2835448.1 D-alanyl-D-alanine carboxypeptidase [Defluviitaleaceae bacterium]